MSAFQPKRKTIEVLAVAVVCILLVSVSGCAGILSTSAPSSLYQLHYQQQSRPCAHAFPASVRIWPMEASPPYDQEALVVLVDHSRVRFSSQYVWVAQPGKMVADWLARDLSQSNLFPSVMTAGEHSNSSYELGGRLFVFAWRQQNDQGQAVLEAEMTLVENRPPGSRQIVMRKPYRLASELAERNDAEAFARAMSQLLADFSAVLQHDLCGAVGRQLPAREMERERKP
jgi:ABC-type uncharacterized transport system auxiliary subunit